MEDEKLNEQTVLTINSRNYNGEELFRNVIAKYYTSDLNESSLNKLKLACLKIVTENPDHGMEEDLIAAKKYILLIRSNPAISV
jgi:hypothetical protein